MAKAVVDGLESIQIQVGDPQQRSMLAGAHHGLLQPARQQYAVGQAGQCVEVGELLQQHLLLALRRHVNGHPQHALRGAACIKAHDLAQIAHPAGLVAARAFQAPGGIKRCGRVGSVARDFGRDAVHIVCRNGLRPAQGLCAGSGVAVAQQGTPAAVAGHGAGLQVPVPQAQRCGRDGE